MKKLFISAAFVAIAALTSCKKDQAPAPVKVTEGFIDVKCLECQVLVTEADGTKQVKTIKGTGGLSTDFKFKYTPGIYLFVSVMDINGSGFSFNVRNDADVVFSAASPEGNAIGNIVKYSIVLK